VGYYTRVLSKRPDCPAHGELVKLLEDDGRDATLSVEEGDAAEWTSLLLSHEDGTEIAAVERNVVAPGALGAEEIAEFIESVADCKPSSAAAWLASYLADVKIIYAFQHLSGTRKNEGDEVLRAVSHGIWARGDAILQADYEGFTNEDGYHILWQFSDDVSGSWWMAVLQDGEWLRFEMELGDREQRAAFFEERIPPGVKTA
jgi:hypothetical protein